VEPLKSRPRRYLYLFGDVKIPEVARIDLRGLEKS
jgi:hypothetical protein